MDCILSSSGLPELCSSSITDQLDQIDLARADVSERSLISFDVIDVDKSKLHLRFGSLNFFFKKHMVNKFAVFI